MASMDRFFYWERKLKISWKPAENQLKTRCKSVENPLKISWKPAETQLKTRWKSWFSRLETLVMRRCARGRPSERPRRVDRAPNMALVRHKARAPRTGRLGQVGILSNTRPRHCSYSSLIKQREYTHMVIFRAGALFAAGRKHDYLMSKGRRREHFPRRKQVLWTGRLRAPKGHIEWKLLSKAVSHDDEYQTVTINWHFLKWWIIYQ